MIGIITGRMVAQLVVRAAIAELTKEMLRKTRPIDRVEYLIMKAAGKDCRERKLERSKCKSCEVEIDLTEEGAVEFEFDLV